MPSNWLFELRNRLDEVINEEMTRIGSGGCSAQEYTADQVAMQYAERCGFVMGLSKALEIANDMEKGG